MPRFPDFLVLRRRRRLLDLSIAEVAKALRCSAALVSEYERGWEPKTRVARERWRDLSIRYARLLDEYERKSKGGRARSKKGTKEASDEKAR